MGLPFPSPGDPPNSRIEPRFPTLQANSLPVEPLGKFRTLLSLRKFQGFEELHVLCQELCSLAETRGKSQMYIYYPTVPGSEPGSQVKSEWDSVAATTEEQLHSVQTTRPRSHSKSSRAESELRAVALQTLSPHQAPRLAWLCGSYSCSPGSWGLWEGSQISHPDVDLSVDWKDAQPGRWELPLIQQTKLRTKLSPGGSLRQLWETALKRQGRSWDIQFFQQRPGSWNIKRLLFIKENRYLKDVKEFSAFLCLGKMQESGLTEIIPLIYTLASVGGQYPVSSGLPRWRSW